jgi:hypothetical protein
VPQQELPDLDAVIDADRQGREMATELLSRRFGG